MTPATASACIIHCEAIAYEEEKQGRKKEAYKYQHRAEQLRTFLHEGAKNAKLDGK